MPPVIKMGFHGQILMGDTGSQAASLLENVKDISYNCEPTTGNTTVRGDSSAPPVQTEDTTVRVLSIEFTMIVDETDTLFEALMVAALSGSAKAIRTKLWSTGKGFDGDCTMGIASTQPLEGEQTVTFSAKPSRSYGRAPVPYA